MPVTGVFIFRLISLASGSSGNCSLITTATTSILVDVGISATAVEKKLEALGMEPGEINGVIVTHAHSDHCAGAAKFCKKYSTVLYSHPLTLNMLKRKKTVGLNELSPLFVRAIEREEWVLGDIHIQNFDLPHTGWLPDGKDHPGQQLGFVFRHQEKKLVYLTDLGTFPEEHFEKIRGCDGYFIESNHDEELQKNSGRDPRLIKRNLSDYGHLSNKQTAQILKKAIIPGGPTTEVKVLLTHLSEHCNTPELVMNTLHQTLSPVQIQKTKVKIAPNRAISGSIDLL